MAFSVLQPRIQLLDTDRNLDAFSTLNDIYATRSNAESLTSGITVNEIDPSILYQHTSSRRQSIRVSDAINAIARKYEISKTMAERLLVLRDFEIVIVCDDSGSMNTTVDGTQRTRWDELRSIVKIVMEIGVIFDSNGVDIYFINGASFHNVKDPSVVDQAFAKSPSGYTPLAPVLTEIFQSTLGRRGRDKKLLVFVCTDGVPTDQDGNETVTELELIMRKTRRAETTYVSFLLCTDDPDCVDYLSGWDRTMSNVDVTDDFHTERTTIRRNRGNNYRFSIGDYIVKALIGAIEPDIDALNEPVPSQYNH